MPKKYLVVGAGVSGLTFADQLTQKGHDVTIVEKDSRYGGLAVTFDYENFLFDSGPHWIFFTPGSVMEKYVCGLLQDDLYPVKLNPGVYFLGKYYPWPLTPAVILRLPFKVMVGAFADIFRVAFSKKREVQNYEDFMLNQFGNTLYELDFEPYTHKFTKTPLQKLHVDWSKIGVNRSLQDKPELSSIFSVIKKTLSPKKTSIGYYMNQGVQGLPDAQWERIKKNGGKMLLNTCVEDVKLEDGRISSVKLSGCAWEEFDHVIWTGRPNDISNLVLSKSYDLHFLTNVFYYVLVKGQQHPPYQWIYYVDDDILFNRLYNNCMFSPKHAPEGSFGYCAEVTCRPGQGAEIEPEKYIDQVIDGLIKTGAVSSREDIIGVHYHVAKEAYPLYSLHYRSELADCLGDLYEKCSNLTMAGRTGLFWYNNIDHSIEGALAEMELLEEGKRSPVKLVKV